jgi:hypothetical protein
LNNRPDLPAKKTRANRSLSSFSLLPKTIADLCDRKRDDAPSHIQKLARSALRNTAGVRPAAFVNFVAFC